jgi:hypothetical protein
MAPSELDEMRLIRIDAGVHIGDALAINPDSPLLDGTSSGAAARGEVRLDQERYHPELVAIFR